MAEIPNGNGNGKRVNVFEARIPLGSVLSIVTVIVAGIINYFVTIGALDKQIAIVNTTIADFKETVTFRFTAADEAISDVKATVRTMQDRDDEAVRQIWGGIGKKRDK
jgi:hypothetical protein